MQIFRYTWGKDLTGLYIDINGSGEAYNLLLLAQWASKRSKRGYLQVSNKPFKGAIRADYIEGTQDREHWFIDDWRKMNMETGHISLPFCSYTAKTIYIRIIPNGSGDLYCKPNK